MNKITRLFGIEHPIVQAPMAGGVTTSNLVAAVSNNGALGMIGAGYMNANDLEKQMKEVKQSTPHPFGVNVFVPGNEKLDMNQIEMAKEGLRPFYEKFDIGIDEIVVPTKETFVTNYEEQIASIIKEGVTVCSFTFGVPDEEVIKKLHEHDILAVGTATTVKEAVWIEQIGMDVIVLQGSEAGGHRGSFLEDALDSQLGLMAFIPQVADRVKIPLIAAGGIMDGRGINAALCLGADAVQMGTGFLLTEESGAHPLHKEKVMEANGDDTVLTKSFSGKYARGIRNEFIENMRGVNEALPTYPYQNTLTLSLRKAAKHHHDAGMMALWSGQSAGLGKRQTVKTFIQNVMKDVK